MSCTKLISTFIAVFFVSGNALGKPQEVNLGFDINFFGKTYSKIYVYGNGYISFGSSINNSGDILSVSRAITDFQIPIIAPTFFTSRYLDSGIGSWGGGSALVSGIGNTTGLSVEWDIFEPWYNPAKDVFGGFSMFMLQLVNRSDTGAGNFDFIFDFIYLYGSDAPYNFSGYAAEGNFYGYPKYAGNFDTRDSYVFEVRDGVVTNPLPLGVVPEPETYAMLLAGLVVVGFAAKRRGRLPPVQI
jgi:hypothetical protein